MPDCPAITRPLLLWISLNPLAVADTPEAAEDTRGVASEPYVVTATRTQVRLRDSPVSTEVIVREEIEQSGAKDLAGLLETHPGVELERSYLGTAIRLQGLEPEHVLILVNGQRVLGAKDGVIDLSRYALENIERVEIVKGPSSALYGSDAMGGVVNIITRQASAPFSAQIQARYGSHDALQISGSSGLVRDSLSSQFSGGWRSQAAFDRDPSDVATSSSAVDQIDVANQTELRLSPDLRLQSQLSYMRRNLQGIDISGSGATFDRRNLIEDFQAAVRPRWVTSKNSLLSVDGSFSIFRDQYFADQRGSDALDSYQDTRERLGQGTIQYDRIVADTHSLTLGVDGLAQEMISERLHQAQGRRLRVAVYGQDVWDVWETDTALTLIPGARVDLDTEFGVHPTPKLGLRYDPRPPIAVRSSYGWGYRAPVFKELLLRFENPGAGYVVQGNPDLEPETSESLQLGVEVDATDALTLEVNGFYNVIDNLISIGTLKEAAAGEPTRYGYVNVDSAVSRGLEATSAFSLAQMGALQLGYTLTDTLDVERDRPLEGRALHKGTAKVSGGYSPWGLHGMTRAALVGEQRFYVDDNGDGQEEDVVTDPYINLDVRLSQALGSLLEIFAGIDNVLNAGDARYLPLPPRFIYVGLSGRFSSKPSEATGS